MTMIRMTYGQLPTYEDFYHHITTKIDPDDHEFYLADDKTYHYEIRGEDANVLSDLGIPTCGRFPHHEFYKILEQLVECGSDPALDIASGFLYTLGYEWI